MNIKNIKTYILSAGLLLSLSSCLDKYPEDSIRMDQAINTVDDIDKLVIGLYDSFKSSALYSGHLTLLPDLQADFVYCVKGYSNTYGDIYRWNDIKATNPEIESVYAALYGVINSANFLLDNAEKVKQNTSDDDLLDKLEQCQGEAYFARALAYSELIKCFCKPYDSDEQAEKELGVVITQRYLGNEPQKRASLKESYEFVLSDLDKATEYLEVGEDFTANLYDEIYFNEYTCHALRARISLYMHRWDDAIKYASKVINGKVNKTECYHLATFSEKIGSVSLYQYQWTAGKSTEGIWKVGFTVNSYGGALGTIFDNFNFVTYRPDYVPAKWVINSYEANDLRPTAIFTTRVTGYEHGLQWPLLSKYFGDSDFLANNILHVHQPTVLRLSEQYLIRAEAYAMKKDYGKAGKDITTIRKARYSSYGGNTALSENNAMEVIEAERVKELYMEGFRLNDLKRWHKGFERKIADQPAANFVQSSLKVEKDDPLFVWPIPQHELESPGSQIEPNESNK